MTSIRSPQSRSRSRETAAENALTPRWAPEECPDAQGPARSAAAVGSRAPGAALPARPQRFSRHGTKGSSRRGWVVRGFVSQRAPHLGVHSLAAGRPLGPPGRGPRRRCPARAAQSVLLSPLVNPRSGDRDGHSARGPSAERERLFPRHNKAGE